MIPTIACELRADREESQTDDGWQHQNGWGLAWEENWSRELMDAKLPEVAAVDREPLLIIGAIAGG
jgi:hypothetical protein